jgi:hypothetical protein
MPADALLSLKLPMQSIQRNEQCKNGGVPKGSAGFQSGILARTWAFNKDKALIAYDAARATRFGQFSIQQVATE